MKNKHAITVALSTQYIGMGFIEEKTGTTFDPSNKFYPIELSLKHDLSKIKELIHEGTLVLIDAPEGFDLGEAPKTVDEATIVALEEEIASLKAELAELKKPAPKAKAKPKAKAEVKEEVAEEKAE